MAVELAFLSFDEELVVKETLQDLVNMLEMSLLIGEDEKMRIFSRYTKANQSSMSRRTSFTRVITKCS